MAITQPCYILINNNSLDRFFLHRDIRTQEIIEVMMLIKIAGESVKFIGSKYIQESPINTSRLGLNIFSFSKKARQKCWPMRARIYFKTKTNDRVASRLAMGLWNICCVKNTAIICWPPRRVTALRVVRTSFLCPRPRLPPWNKPILDIPKSERSIVYRPKMAHGFQIEDLHLLLIPMDVASSSAQRKRLSFFFLLFLLLIVSDCWNWLFRKVGSRVFLS